MSLFGSIKKAVKKNVVTVATGGLNKVAANKTVSKAVDKITKPVGSRVTAAAKAMRLPSVATNLNIKKAITNPIGYAKDNAKAYAKDATIAVSVYNNLKKGNVKGIVTQGIADTKAAAKAVSTGKMQAVDWTLDKPTLPEPIPAAPTYSQLTGDLPIVPMPAPVTPPKEWLEETSAGPSKTPLIIGAAIAAAVILLLVVVK